MRRTSHFLQMRFAYSMGPMSVFCKATYIHFLFDGIYAAYSQCDVCCIERIFGLVFLLVLRTYVLRAISVERNIQRGLDVKNLRMHIEYSQDFGVLSRSSVLGAHGARSI